MKRAYTRVLQGHIAVATATFPLGADAGGLGTFSRKFLWE
jgi:Xaa-Pro aminopeptidase